MQVIYFLQEAIPPARFAIPPPRDDRMLMLSMTDGVRKVYGIETYRRPIQAIQPSAFCASWIKGFFHVTRHPFHLNIYIYILFSLCKGGLKGSIATCRSNSLM